MKDIIEKFIIDSVKKASPPIFREPLIGYSSAKDPIFGQLKTVIGENQLLPGDLLPDAKTVLAFFLPYSKEVISSNKEEKHASRQWAEAYDYTNWLINKVLQQLNEIMAVHGVKMAWLLPTYEFDKKKLVAQWSHKHVAYACGLGTFGRNQLLITPKGCGGRFGTAVLNITMEPSKRSEVTHACLADSGCDYCKKKCPVQALSETAGYDRHRCYELCLDNDRLFSDLESVEVCGKCATGPCAYME